MTTAIQSWCFRDRKKEPTFDIYRALDLTEEMGFQGIEIISGDLASEDEQGLQAAKDYATKRGVTVNAVFVFTNFARIDKPEVVREDIAKINRWLRICGSAEVPFLSMLSGVAREGLPREEQRKSIRKAFGQCVPVAEQNRVTMVIENFGGLIFWAQEMVDFIQEVGSQHLRINIDTEYWAGQEFFTTHPDPAGVERLYENAAIAAPFAATSHIKIKGLTDNDRLLGYGDDLSRLIWIYHLAGFQGPLTFESIVDGDILAPLPRARELVDGAIAKVQRKE
jgi:sugar phosphate isomerase/epimerase